MRDLLRRFRRRPVVRVVTDSTADLPPALAEELGIEVVPLLVIFGDLRWRSVGTIGNPDIYTRENETGPDDANHAQQGLYVVSHPSLDTGRRDASIYDVAPTILKMMGHPAPADLRGAALT